MTNLKVLELDDMIEHILKINDGHLIMEDDIYNINSTISSTVDLGNSNNNSLIQHNSIITTTTTTDNAINDGSIVDHHGDSNHHDHDNDDDYSKNIEYMTDEDWKLTVNKRILSRKNSHNHQTMTMNTATVKSTTRRHNPLQRNMSCVSTDAVLQSMIDNTLQPHPQQQQQHQHHISHRQQQRQHHHHQLGGINEDSVQSSSTSSSIGAHENYNNNNTIINNNNNTNNSDNNNKININNNTIIINNNNNNNNMTTTSTDTTTTTNSNNNDASGLNVLKTGFNGIQPAIITLDELKSPTLIEKRFKWATNNTNDYNDNGVTKKHQQHSGSSSNSSSRGLNTIESSNSLTKKTPLPSGM